MARIVAYLTFDGNCREAMGFYKDAFGGTLSVTTVGESPAFAQLPSQSRDHVMHAELKSDSFSLMASDNLGGAQIKVGSAISLMLYCTSEVEIRSVYPKLAAGGTVNSELKIEFWGSLYGDITDRFGIRWMLNFDMPKA